MSAEDGNAARAYNRAMKELGTVTTAIWENIGAVAAPILTDIARLTTEACHS